MTLFVDMKVQLTHSHSILKGTIYVLLSNCHDQITVKTYQIQCIEEQLPDPVTRANLQCGQSVNLSFEKCHHNVDRDSYVEIRRVQFLCDELDVRCA